MKKILAAVLCMLAVMGSLSVSAEEVFRTSVRGFGGDVAAEVTVNEQGKIVDLIICADQETPGIGVEAAQKLADAIKEAGSTEVDLVAGATITSQAVVEAVNYALREAGVKEEADTEITFVPGVYLGTAQGRIGQIMVQVTVGEKTIESIEIVEHTETPGISDLPLSRIVEDIIRFQSLDVDVVGGATATSQGVLSAVTNALVQAGGNIDALKSIPVKKEMPACEDMQTQVVIAGGGMSGLVAAVSAAHAGAEVILVEKQEWIGGSLMLAAGTTSVAESKYVREGGFDDSIESAMAFKLILDEMSEYKLDRDFVAYLLKESGKTVDYLIDEFDFKYTLDASGSVYLDDIDGKHEGYGMAYALERAALQEGVQILKSTKAEHVKMENGSAVGLVVSNEAGEYTIYADKVILATGGASGSMEQMIEGTPELAITGLYNEAGAGNTGDGYTMLKEVGAKMGAGPRVKSAFPDFSPLFRFTWKNNPTLVNSLIVKADGKRFGNEAPMSNPLMLNAHLIKAASPAYYGIFDTVHTDVEFLKMMKEFAVDNNTNVVVYGETIEELAANLNIDAAVLQETFDVYQTACKNGKDTEFGKDAKHLIAYADEGGYYAARVYPGAWGSFGGALTDYQFRVLDQNDMPIENLFAVGECATSTLYGDYYFGCSLSYYSAAGKIAGETAAKEIAENR